MGDELYIEPNRKTQIIVLLVIIFAALIIASIELMVSYLTPSLTAPLEELEAGARLLLLLALCVNVAGVVLSVIWVVYFARIGYRTFKFGNYPPPGAIIVFRTKVRTGKEAVISGWLSILFAVMMLLPVALLVYLTLIFRSIL